MELVHSLAKHFQMPLNKLNNVNVNYLKIPKNHRGPHATLGPSVCEICAMTIMLLLPTPKN